MAAQTFKVGDKVRVLAGGEGVVTYGPVNSTFDSYKMYVVKQDGDEERAFKVADLEALPAFAVGDIVTLTARNSRATVEYGPFDNPGRVLPDVYVVKLVDPPADDNPRTFTALASVMEKAAEAATSGDTFEFDGVPYEYGALYLDTDGDYFEIRPVIDGDGTPNGRYRYKSPLASPSNWEWTLAEVAYAHGPLTKVTS